MSPELLTFDGYIRAMAFLAGRDQEIFHEPCTSWDVDIRRGRTESMSHEATFRSLSSEPRRSGTPDTVLEKPNDDVLNVIAII